MDNNVDMKVVRLNEIEEAEHGKVFLAITRMRKGDSIVYHTGYLPKDMSRGETMEHRYQSRGRKSAAWKAYEIGKCLLVQKRLDASMYDYIAVRR